MDGINSIASDSLTLAAILLFYLLIHKNVGLYS